MVVFFILLSAIPLQAAAMWTHTETSWLDWLVLAFLAILVVAHVGSKVPE
ncbi:hypothetical protein [Sphingopyxis sp.]|nr:hypothetical protein [Sphingopyxis sp.]MBW8296190.1 hypothetical protein [Sphingopyxis sp.]